MKRFPNQDDIYNFWEPFLFELENINKKYKVYPDSFELWECFMWQMSVEEEKTDNKYFYEYLNLPTKELLKIRWNLKASTFEEFDEVIQKAKAIDKILSLRENRENQNTYVKDEEIWEYIIKLIRVCNAQKINVTLEDVCKMTQKQIDVIMKEIEKNPYKGLI